MTCTKRCLSVIAEDQKTQRKPTSWRLRHELYNLNKELFAGMLVIPHLNENHDLHVMICESGQKPPKLTGQTLDPQKRCEHDDWRGGSGWSRDLGGQGGQEGALVGVVGVIWVVTQSSHTK